MAKNTKKKSSQKTKMSKAKATKATPKVANTNVLSGLLNGLFAPEPEEEGYVPGTYTSRYSANLDSALNSMQNFNYNPLQDASYQALAKVYGARGNIAAKDTLADAAALNGGMQTSYAVSAAQQARNQYNQELAALVPELEANAYNRAQATYYALRDIDDAEYGRFRDTEGDKQWKYSMDYGASRDKVSDSQWQKEFAYQQKRDKVADKQWAKEYALAKKNSSGGSSGGGGRRSSGGSRRSSGGSGGGYTGSTTSGGTDYYSKAQKIVNNQKKKTGTKAKTLTANKTATAKKNKLVRMAQ